MEAWRPFVIRRRQGRHGYELFLADATGVVMWQLERAPPRDPRAPALARLADATSQALWLEGVSADGPVVVWDAGGYRCEGELSLGLERGKLRVLLRGRKVSGTYALGRQKGTWRGRRAPPLKSPLWELTAVPASALASGPYSPGSILSGNPIEDADGAARRANVGVIVASAGARRGSVPWRQARAVADSDARPAFSDPDWLFELRPSGHRVLAGTFRGRGIVIDVAGSDLSPLFPEVARALAAIGGGAVFDGELSTERERLDLTAPREIEEASLAAPATLHAFDLIAHDRRDLRPLPLLVRKQALAALLDGAHVVAYVDHLIERGEDLAAELGSRSVDTAVVARRASATYAPEQPGLEARVQIAASAATAGKSIASANPPVRTTNRAKVFWPESGATKGDLLDYYEAVAPALLPHIADRPLVLTRFPDGIHGKSFFQHHAPGAKSAWLRTVRIKTARRWRDYFVCESAEDLLYLANLGTIELHGWPSRARSIERPDFCTLDLDRSAATIADVVEVARAGHNLCESLGLPALLKTSGGDGLHIVIPLGGQLDYEGARILGELIARTLAAELPRLASIEPSIKARTGRVYLDYLVNARGRLLVVPYGVRARPGAPVSTPLEWGELDGTFDPRAFEIHSVKRRLAAAPDPWRGFLAHSCDVERALSRLRERPTR